MLLLLCLFVEQWRCVVLLEWSDLIVSGGLSVVSVCVDVCVNVFVMKRRSVVVTLFVCRAVAMCCAPCGPI